MVGTTYHLRTFFDVKDDDLFFATSDIGWIVGHSYMVYAPSWKGSPASSGKGPPTTPTPGPSGRRWSATGWT